jgi:hypothetical protein
MAELEAWTKWNSSAYGNQAIMVGVMRWTMPLKKIDDFVDTFLEV